MSKRLMIVAGVALAAIVLGAALVLPTLAQEPTPTPKAYGWHGWGRGFGIGRGLCGQGGLEAAAEALGMTADELSTQLWGGRTLAELADKAGVDLQTVRDGVEAACEAARQEALAAFRDAIEQAVTNGDLTREQADWLLKGIDLGFMPGGRGFGRGFGFGPGMRGRFGGFAPMWLPFAAPSSSS